MVTQSFFFKPKEKVEEESQSKIGPDAAAAPFRQKEKLNF
jgi:hypothetical protein